jgi:beta-phosphoglucomutase-like phosphatase (HAD superfamily)
MRPVEGVFLEPVGCMADFPSEPFIEIAAQLFQRRKSHGDSGSKSYWHLLNLIEAANETLDASAMQKAEELEIQAVNSADIYEDVAPALAELKGMGVKLALTSSLSVKACLRFVERGSLSEYFDVVSAREADRHVKTGPLERALRAMSVDACATLFLTDTMDGLKVAGVVGLNAVLMMNDPDEAMRLAEYHSSGIVSLHELPDFIRLVQSAKKALD